MKERSSSSMGSCNQSRVSRGSQPPRGYRPRDATLFSSYHKTKKAKGYPKKDKSGFKYDDVCGSLGEALREAGL